MTIEQLTDEDRRYLARGDASETPQRKALRIIDRDAATLARVRSLYDARDRYERDELCEAWGEAIAGAVVGERDSLLVSKPEWLKTQKDLAAANARVAELECQYETSHNSRLHAEDALRAANARADAAELRVIEYQACYAALESEVAQWKAKFEAAERDRELFSRDLAAVRGERDRAESEAAALRERISVEESARAKSETLLQQTGARLDAIQQAAHSACLFWESTENHSLREIRTGMKALREVLNNPALRTEAASLRLALDLAHKTANEETAQANSLRAERDALRAEVNRVEANLRDSVAALREEVERLRVLRQPGKSYAPLVARLAAATELLQTAARHRDAGWESKRNAFLANAPSAKEQL